MKLLPLLALLILAGCAPLPAVAPVEAAPAAQLGAAIGAATQAAERRADNAQATAGAIELRRINAEREAAAAQASLEAARLDMQRQQASATQSAGATSDALALIGTRSAISATQTASAIQALALGQQATGTAVSGAATRQVVELQSSAEALLIPQEGAATGIAMRQAPTTTAQAIARQEKRLDGTYSTLSGFCGFGLLVIGLCVSWAIVKTTNTVNQGLAIRAALPPTVAVIKAPAQPAQQIAARPTELQRFVEACIDAAGEDATTLPGYRDLAGDYASGSAWSQRRSLLEGRGLIVRGEDGRYHPAGGRTLGELYDALPEARE